MRTLCSSFATSGGLDMEKLQPHFYEFLAVLFGLLLRKQVKIKSCLSLSLVKTMIRLLF